MLTVYMHIYKQDKPGNNAVLVVVFVVVVVVVVLRLVLHLQRLPGWMMGRCFEAEREENKAKNRSSTLLPCNISIYYNKELELYIS